MRIHKTAFVVVTVLCCALAVLAQTEAKPKLKLTLDEFFNSVYFTAGEISPDGNAVVIGTERADWDQQIFRDDLWLYRDDSKGGALVPLTQSGHDSEPKWSPDGRWIAFLSERKSSAEKSGDSDDPDSSAKDESVSQIYLISPNGGEAVALTQGDEGVHAFAWSADSQTIYFATRQPWTNAQKDAYKKEWKDVVQYRSAERGDTIFALDVGAAIARDSTPAFGTADSEKDDKPGAAPGAVEIAQTLLRIDRLFPSPDGASLGFLTNAINQREEKYENIEIYTLALPVSRRALDQTGTPSPPAR